MSEDTDDGSRTARFSWADPSTLPDDAKVSFKAGDAFLMIVHLTGAIVHLTNASISLANNDQEGARESANGAGQQADKVLAFFKTAMEEAVAKHASE